MDKLKVYVRLDDLKALEKSIRDFGQYRGIGFEWESYIGDDYDTYYKFIEDALRFQVYIIFMKLCTALPKCLNV